MRAAQHSDRTAQANGPQLFSRILGLNDTQEGVLNLVFKVADDQGLLLLDLKDLRAMATFVGEHAGEFRTEYGNVSTASIGAIQRGLLALEEQGDTPQIDAQVLLQVPIESLRRFGVWMNGRLEAPAQSREALRREVRRQGFLVGFAIAGRTRRTNQGR